jgi:hypothetical protein
LYDFSSKTDDIQVLLPATGQTFAVATYYNDGACSNLLAFDAAVVDECVADTSSSSLIVNYPTEIKYNTSTTCTGPSEKTVYPEKCSASGKTGTSFTNVNSMVVTTTTGWYLTYGFDNNNCGGAAYGVTAYATGVCLQSASSTSTKIDCTISSKHLIKQST